jgi:pSer/pThr/pTyr-binding forkhead associated (FHA) protein
MHFRVSIEAGPKEEVKIEGSHFSLGRSLNNDIPIAHESIGPKHLKIRVKRGKFYVTDLDTASGTFMGEEKLIPNEEKEWPIFLPLRLGLLASVEIMENALLRKRSTMSLPRFLRR